MSTKTIRGVVRAGKIEADLPGDLADGTEVYVVSPRVPLAAAQRRVAVWLIEEVGNLLRAGEGELVQTLAGWVWRFHIYSTSVEHAPWGPIGTVELDADTGEVLDPIATLETLQQDGRQYRPPVSPTAS